MKTANMINKRAEDTRIVIRITLVPAIKLNLVKKVDHSVKYSLGQRELSYPHLGLSTGVCPLGHTGFLSQTYVLLSVLYFAKMCVDDDEFV